MRDSEATLATVFDLPGLPVWQQRILDGMLSARAGGMSAREIIHRQYLADKRAIKAQEQRRILRAVLLAGGHAHVAATDGLWCVTGDGVQLATLGPLWERLPSPPRGLAADMVIYDEIMG